MSKIKQYNQVLLAIIGTLGLILMCGIALFCIYEMISLSSRRNHNDQSGIIAKTKVDSLVALGERGQVLSLGRFVPIDTIDRNYIIPVGHNNLNESEPTGGLLGIRKGSYSGGKKFYGNGRSKDYNNLILYESETQKTRPIFDERASISDFYTFFNGRYLVIRCAKVDTNKDNYIDESDLQELYVYDVTKYELQRINKPDNISFISRAQGIEKEKMIFLFGIDRDKNGKFSVHKEPQVYYALELEQKKLQPLMPEQQINQIQELLEGTRAK